MAVPAWRTNVPDNLAVNGARDAVLQLEVHLGNRVLSEHRGIRDITCGGEDMVSNRCSSNRWCRRRTDGSGLNHVADGEALDGLVLGSASRAVGAADGLDVAAALLVAAVVLSLLDHLGGVLSDTVLKMLLSIGRTGGGISRIRQKARRAKVRRAERGCQALCGAHNLVLVVCAPAQVGACAASVASARGLQTHTAGAGAR